MKLLLYCTKAKPYLSLVGKYDSGKNYYEAINDDTIFDNKLNGKIVAECDFEVIYEDTSYSCIDFRLASSLDGISRLDKSCLTTEQLFDYVKGKNEFYSICIKNLKIFDKPRELSDYFTEKPYKDINKIFTDEIMVDGKWYRPVNKAPQNMMRVWEDLENPRILISIQPQWLCKILNKEKTIEIRKKVLKEMLK